MTNETLIDKVRRQLGDDGYDATDITDASNWFVDELANNNHLRIYEDSEELNADTNDTAMEFPDNMKKLVSFYMTSPRVLDMMPGYNSYGDFMASYANFASATTTQARDWTDWANSARFATPLNAAHTFQCDFIRRPVAVEELTDEYDMPIGYDELLVMGTTIRIMEIDESYTEADIKRGILEPLMTTFIRNESRGQIKTGPNIMRTGRGKRTYSAKDF